MTSTTVSLLGKILRPTTAFVVVHRRHRHIHIHHPITGAAWGSKRNHVHHLRYQQPFGQLQQQPGYNHQNSLRETTRTAAASIHNDHHDDDDINANDSHNADADTEDIVTAKRVELSHDNIYQQWTIDDDRLLWENHSSNKKPIVEIASILGRGINGVTKRLTKLKNINSSAYQRLFVGGVDVDADGDDDNNNNRNGKMKNGKNKNNKKKGKKTRNIDDDDDDTKSSPSTTTKKKLVPITEVLRRIEWDMTLRTQDFYIRYYDRVDDTIHTTQFDAPNTSISSSQTSFIKALPEHRIVSVLYKDRIVWDRTTKLDLVFGGSNGGSDSDGYGDGNDATKVGGIAHVIETYPEWEDEQQQLQRKKEERRHYIEYIMTRMLGLDHYDKFKKLLDELYAVHDDLTTSTKRHIEQNFVPQALSLLVQIRNNENHDSSGSTSMDPTLIPQSDWLALDMISEFIAATIEDDELRSQTLWEISYKMDQIDGRSGNGETNSILSSSSSSAYANDKNEDTVIRPIVLNEDELEESFVRGSGPGGQKINKTSNRVLLVHVPTSIRVECQDTRSLQQNRKLARKRLLSKLDEYYNGRQSKTSQQNLKASQKRQRSKTKNRSRQRKKLLEKQQQQQQQQYTEQLDEQYEFFDGDK